MSAQPSLWDIIARRVAGVPVVGGPASRLIENEAATLAGQTAGINLSGQQVPVHILPRGVRDIPVLGGVLNETLTRPVNTLGLLTEAGARAGMAASGGLDAANGGAAGAAFVNAPGNLYDKLLAAHDTYTQGSGAQRAVGTLEEMVLNPLSWLGGGAGAAERAGAPALATGLRALNEFQALPFQAGASGVRLLRDLLPTKAAATAAESLAGQAERVPMVPARAPNLAQLAQGRGAVPPAPPVTPPLPEALAPTRTPSILRMAQGAQPAAAEAPSATLAAAAPAAESGLTAAERAYLAKFNIPESAVAGSRPALDALAGAPAAAPPPPPVSLPAPAPIAPQEAVPAAPGWLQQELANRNDLATRLGLGDAIEQLSAQRLTAAQVAAALREQFPERTAGLVGKGINDDLLGLVRATRAARGIPSMDDATAFEAWLAGRGANAPQEAAQAATGASAATPPAALTAALDAAPATRAEGLAALSGRDTNTLLGLAYDHPNAVANAQVKYTDPVALRDRAIERIQADRGRGERLAALDPDLAARVAALPDAAPGGTGVAPTLGETAPISPTPPDIVRPAPAPGTLPAAPPATNDRVPLGQYTDRLYRETDVAGAMPFLDRLTADTTPRDLPMSNTPDLALGQGTNRGVLLELDPAGIQGQINRAKPTYEPAWRAGVAEFVATHQAPSELRDAVRAVTVAPDAAGTAGENIRLRRVLAGLEQQGWTKETLPDGGARYTRPTAPATGGDVATGVPGAPIVSPLAAPIRAAQGALPVARGIHDIAWANLVDANTGEAARSSQGAVPEFLAQMRAMRTTGPYTFLRNSIGAGWSLALKSPEAVPLFRDNIAEGLGAIPQLAADLRAIRARPDLTEPSRAQSVAEAYARTLPAETRALLAPHGPDAVAQYIDAIGENWAARDLPAALRVGAAKGAAMGAAAGLASPYTPVVGPLAAGVSALAGAALPYTKTAQNLVLGTVETAARDAAARPVLAEALAAGRPVEEAIAAAGAAAKDTFGDYSDRGRLLGLLNSFFPGIDWNVEQAGVLARRAAEHPAVAMGVLAAMLREAQAHQLDPEHAGTIRVGPVNINPLYPETPIGPEALTVPRTLAREPNAPLLDKIHTITSAAGLYTSPLLDVPAYALGAQQRAPASSERLLPVAEYLDATLGLPRAVNPVGAPLEMLHQATTGGQVTSPLDTQAALNMGTYRDPRVLRAGAEIVQEETGKPLAARANVQRATELLDPSSDLYRRAQQRALGSKAAEAAANFVTGVPVRAQTETARTAELVANALPSPEQVALVGSPNRAVREKALAALPDFIARPPATMPAAQQAAVVQAQVDALRAGVPGGNVYQGADERAIAERAMETWDRARGGLQAVAPQTFALMRAQEQERLGLAPQGGTAASRQAAYDQALLAGYLMSPIGAPLGGLPGGLPSGLPANPLVTPSWLGGPQAAPAR